MSTSVTLLLLSLMPFALLVVVFGTIVVVALCQAKPEDVPAVFRESGAVFKRLADRLPRTEVLRGPLRGDVIGMQNDGVDDDHGGPDGHPGDVAAKES
ncbi:hypothetical protein [Kribbella jiaozuonensis]|uniref:Uncharacterized protein n=1 Tax=Kribbella jiaozuonensis TaxID=2575441 RepID=A0A4U3M4W5_9ACTN|nr:hypothetical protein [Kribbella jiaozuonensis]TKK79182.1 hypothetical protein FDA38_12180 [Kribbella jiaozuonensis]TKK83252.1 hypothetical protein FDA38_11135 [Kribbella jiaozuonensis]